MLHSLIKLEAKRIQMMLKRINTMSQKYHFYGAPKGTLKKTLFLFIISCAQDT